MLANLVYLVSSLTSHFLSDFRQCSIKKSEHLGDVAVDSQRYDEAISHYSTALLLNSPSPQGILVKRSKARLATGPWKHALDEANQVHHFYPMEVNLLTHRHQVIALDRLSPRGYEMKHAALHGAGDFDNAVDALETMLSKIAQSPDPGELCPCYHNKDGLFTLIDRIW